MNGPAARMRPVVAVPSWADVTRHDGVVLGVVIALAVAGGAAAAVAPIIALGLAAGATIVVGTLAAGSRARTFFLIALAAALLGYGLLSRGFAYIGARPIFVGEVLLVVGSVAFVMSVGRARFRVTHLVLVAFMVWGVARTLPFVGTYGVDALRDAVTWLYAAFALIVSVLVHRDDVPRLVRAYGWYVPVFVAWVPLSTIIVYAGVVPYVPGTEVPIIGFKAGDMGVQLAGVAAFILSGLFATTPAARHVPTWAIWVVWLIGSGIVAALNRGALIAMGSVALLALVVRPSAHWMKGAAVMLLAVFAAAVINPSIDVGDRRMLSVGQVIENVQSVFNETGNEDLDGSREWRIAWWTAIIDYTVDGPYFWTGKGFGVNLADEDGFQVGDVGTETSLRAPHNGHFELLARTGVPGIVLWLLLQVSWLMMMLRAAVIAWRTEKDRRWWSGVIGWLVVFWAACLVNMSFDVFLQGPHGGIWFWSIVGLGIAVATAIDASARDRQADEAVSRSAATEPST